MREVIFCAALIASTVVREILPRGAELQLARRFEWHNATQDAANARITRRVMVESKWQYIIWDYSTGERSQRANTPDHFKVCLELNKTVHDDTTKACSVVLRETGLMRLNRTPDIPFQVVGGEERQPFKLCHSTTKAENRLIYLDLRACPQYTLFVTGAELYALE